MSKPVITTVDSFAVRLTIRTTHMPVFGEALVGADFDMGPGGQGSNQAIGVARLGLIPSLGSRPMVDQFLAQHY